MKRENCQQSLHPKKLLLVPFSLSPRSVRGSVCFSLISGGREEAWALQTTSIPGTLRAPWVLIFPSISSVPDLIKSFFICNDFLNNKFPLSSLQTQDFVIYIFCFPPLFPFCLGECSAVSILILAGKISRREMGSWLCGKVLMGTHNQVFNLRLCRCLKVTAF